MRHIVTRILATLFILVLMIGMAPAGLTVQASQRLVTVYTPDDNPNDFQVPEDFPAAWYEDHDVTAMVNAQYRASEATDVIVYGGWNWNGTTTGYNHKSDLLYIYSRYSTDDSFTKEADDSTDLSKKFEKRKASKPIVACLKGRESVELKEIKSAENIPTSVEPIGRYEALQYVSEKAQGTRKVILSFDGTYYYIATIRFENGEYVVDSIRDRQYNGTRATIKKDIEENGTIYYYLPVPGSSDPGKATDEDSKEHSHDDCGVEWSVGTVATETTNGVMVVKCAGCGAVLYEVPISPMTVWSSNMTTKIQDAEPGSTVVIDAHDFKSIHRSVLDAFRQNPGVNIQINWLDENKEPQTITIPAGSAEKLNALFNLDKKNVDKDGNGMFCGFKAMVGQF